MQDWKTTALGGGAGMVQIYEGVSDILATGADNPKAWANVVTGLLFALFGLFAKDRKKNEPEA